MKDGGRIEPRRDRNLVYLRTGGLVIRMARAEDEGLYTCVAENSVAQRATNPVQVVVEGKFTDGSGMLHLERCWFI